jgi:uncharacterized membrane protein
MSSDFTVVVAIVVMGFATYGTRLAGYWLLQGRRIEGRFKAAMDAVPPAILVAVVAPAIFLQGTNNMIAGGVAMVAALLRMPLLVTIAFGVGSVAVLRAMSGGG